LDQEIAMKKTTLALALAAIASGPAFAADSASIDWSKVPSKKVKLFYSGQASYEWLQTKEHKKGDRAGPLLHHLPRGRPGRSRQPLGQGHEQ
jgi:hypothetical protein